MDVDNYLLVVSIAKFLGLVDAEISTLEGGGEKGTGDANLEPSRGSKFALLATQDTQEIISALPYNRSRSSGSSVFQQSTLTSSRRHSHATTLAAGEIRRPSSTQGNVHNLKDGPYSSSSDTSSDSDASDANDSDAPRNAASGDTASGNTASGNAVSGNAFRRESQRRKTLEARNSALASFIPEASGSNINPSDIEGGVGRGGSGSGADILGKNDFGSSVGSGSEDFERGISARLSGEKKTLERIHDPEHVGGLLRQISEYVSSELLERLKGLEESAREKEKEMGDLRASAETARKQLDQATSRENALTVKQERLEKQLDERGKETRELRERLEGLKDVRTRLEETEAKNAQNIERVRKETRKQTMHQVRSTGLRSVGIRGGRGSEESEEEGEEVEGGGIDEEEAEEALRRLAGAGAGGKRKSVQMQRPSTSIKLGARTSVDERVVAELAELRARLETAETDLDARGREVRKAQEQLKEGEDRERALLAECSEKVAELSRLQEEVARLEGVVRQTEREMNEKIEAIRDQNLRSRLEEEQGLRAGLEAEYIKRKEEVERSLAELLGRVEELQLRLTGKEAELAEREKALGALIEELKMEVETMGERLEGVNKKLGEREEEIKEGKTLVEQLKGELTDVRETSGRTVKEYEERLGEMTETENGLLSSLEEEKLRGREREDRILALTSELRRKCEEMKSLEMRLERVLVEMESERTQSLKEKGELQGKMDRELEESKNARRILEKEIKDLLGRIESLQAKLKHELTKDIMEDLRYRRLHFDFEKLNAALQSTLSELQSQRSEGKRLAGRVADLERERRRLIDECARLEKKFKARLYDPVRPPPDATLVRMLDSALVTIEQLRHHIETEEWKRKQRIASACSSCRICQP